MKIPSRFISALFIVLSFAWTSPVLAQTIYVAISGNDTTGTGTSAKPYASLARAQQAIQMASCGTRTQPAIVNIGQGSYYLALSPTNPGTLIFTCKDSGTAPTNTVTWQSDPANTGSVTVNGGVLVKGVTGKSGLGLNWTATTGHGLTVSNVWQVTLPASVGTFSLQPFESLYYMRTGTSGFTRRLRARVESSSSNSVGYYMQAANTCLAVPGGASAPTANCNWGTFMRVGNTVTPGTTLAGTGTGACPSVSNGGTPPLLKCLDRFVYNTGDPIDAPAWTNLNGTYDASKLSTTAGPPCDFTTGAGTYPEGDVSLMLFDAWTVDSMRIACVDTTDKVVFLAGATKQNGGVYNFFGPAVGHRYVVENVLDDFFTAANNGQTQLWFLDRSGTSPVLYYIAGTSEVPNSDNILIPQLPYSAQLSNQIPQSTTNSDFVGGSLLWAKAAIGTAGLSNVTFSNIGFQADNFVPSLNGFNNDDNGDIALPQAIDCEGCQNVTFDGVTVSHTSASGLLVASPPSNTSTTSVAKSDAIQNSSFIDVGDSGIRIGHQISATADTTTTVVNAITINNNLVDGYSRVFPDGEGISGGNGQGITITHNDITDGYHAGVSICHLGCGPFNASTHIGVNGSNVLTQLNHLWNMMQGITSDGGSLYYHVGNTSGSGNNDVIDSNLIHDTSDASVIDGYMAIPGTGYGGDGVYLDGDSAGVLVENNVVYHVSGNGASMTAAPTTSFAQAAGGANAPNQFKNNIFSLAIRGMFAEGTPWPTGACPTTPLTTAQFFWNIWNTDLNEDTTTGFGTFAQGGCTNSCGQPYYQFQDFEANAYWRANTGTTMYPTFCNDPNAFHVLANPAARMVPGSCPTGTFNSALYDWLTFDKMPTGLTWQQGAPTSTPVTMNEDDAQDTTAVKGTCSFNPAFGVTGNPSDYNLSTSPNSQFVIANTNATITGAGRTSGSTIPTVLATFPTYKYPTSTQPW